MPALALPRAATLVLAVSALLWARAPGTARAQLAPGEGTDVIFRVGVYGDNDRTQVNRYLVSATTALGKGFYLGATVGIDTISSASVDVRAQPDAISNASPSLKPHLTDQRNEYNLNLTYSDPKRGWLGSFGALFANEIDYQTFGFSARGAREFLEGNTTLLAGLVFGRDRVSSVVDKTFNQHLITIGYSLGVAQVLSPRTVLRVRYDGGVLSGYQASPYRVVRYGNWTAVPKPGGDALLFVNTTAETPEHVPDLRVRNAGVVELVQGVAPNVALAPTFTLSIDSWLLLAEAVGLELRVSRPAGWLFVAGYRFYNQNGANFFKPQYTGSPGDYTYVTADKKLGKVMAHSGALNITYAILERPQRRVGLAADLRGEVLHYEYPGFLLLSSKTGFYSEAGLRLSF
jgi:hypothetical protein